LFGGAAMKLDMNKKDIIDYINKSEESSVYLSNILKKYPDEFYNFLDEISNLEVNVEENADLDSYKEKFRKFALELVIQRLRQLSCFGNPSKDYVKKVFKDTLKNIK
jgi:hypothetical protein